MHVVKALRFEPSHVQKEFIRVCIRVRLAQVTGEPASHVTGALGLATLSTLNVGAATDPAPHQSKPAAAFIAAIGQHRFWSRKLAAMPAAVVSAAAWFLRKYPSCCRRVFYRL